MVELLWSLVHFPNVVRHISNIYLRNFVAGIISALCTYVIIFVFQGYVIYWGGFIFGRTFIYFNRDRINRKPIFLILFVIFCGLEFIWNILFWIAAPKYEWDIFNLSVIGLLIPGAIGGLLVTCTSLLLTKIKWISFITIPIVAAIIGYFLILNKETPLFYLYFALWQISVMILLVRFSSLSRQEQLPTSIASLPIEKQNHGDV